MNKLVIFDLDGTLCDTLDDLTYYVNDACEKFGFPKCDKKTVRTHVCYPSLEFFSRCLRITDLDEQTKKRYHDYYGEQYRLSGSPRTSLFPGMEKTLYKLKEKGFKLAILTNKTQDQTDEIYNKYVKHVGFDKVVGLRDGVVAKPDPTEIYNLMKEFAKEYPEYGFEKHKGYGTKIHIEKIKEIGPCKLHRKTFIKNFWVEPAK